MAFRIGLSRRSLSLLCVVSAGMAIAAFGAAIGSETPSKETRAGSRVEWAKRGDYGRRLEPKGDRVLHGAGQSDPEFRRYYDLMGGAKPLIYMTYVSLKPYPGRGDASRFFARLAEQLAQYGDTFLIPQIGLSMTRDGSPQEHYEQDVAAGKYDAEIETFCQGLRALKRPAFVRIGYEFNGGWNGYRPETYKAAWIRIVAALRKHNLDDVATVWCYHPSDGKKTYPPYYPGDQYVDWWGIDLFTPSHFAMDDAVAFVEEADARGLPVMIGESTPRGVGVLDGAKSWEAWFARYLDFIRRHRSVKAFCYISWDWANYARWKTWGNGRIGDNPVVLDRWRREMADPHYLHGAPETTVRNALAADGRR